MKASALVLMVVLLVASQLHHASALYSTVPAFMWTRSFDGRMKENVCYQTLSPKNLARSVLDEGGWSSLLCAGKSDEPFLDTMFVFIGRELHSEDVASGGSDGTSVQDLLKVAVTSSNFSVAFPYVRMEEQERMENSLLTEFYEVCDHGLEVGRVILVGSCHVEDQVYQNFDIFGSMNDYFAYTEEKESKGLPDLTVYCQGDDTTSERDVLHRLMSSLDQNGVKYSVLYASNPHESSHFPLSRHFERFLFDDSSGNESTNATLCDGVCQIKTSLIEGILVGVVLLVILISGLWCMMGIDTPARFEAPQDSL